MPSVSARCARFPISRCRPRQTSSPSPTRRSAPTTSSGMPNVRFDAGLAKIASKDDWRVVAEGLGFTEGPVWHHDGYRLNSPNDIIVRSDGRIFFTDPPYGIQENQRELPYNGVFTIDTSGELTLLIDDFDRPNGLALSLDERTLYIDDTNRKHV